MPDYHSTDKVKDDDIESSENKIGPGYIRYVDPSLLVELLRLAQQAMSPGEPAHFATADQVVERAATYWKFIEEKTA